MSGWRRSVKFSTLLLYLKNQNQNHYQILPSFAPYKRVPRRKASTFWIGGLGINLEATELKHCFFFFLFDVETYQSHIFNPVPSVGSVSTAGN